MRTGTMFVVLLMATIFNTEAKTIKVPQDHGTIQSAIDAATNGDTVLVADGTYTENIVLRKKIVVGSYFMVDNDIAHISKTILDGGTPVHADSASVIRIFAGTDTTTTITGFTIRNGKGTKLDLAGSADWISGGGILVWAGGAKITHNIITGNSWSTSLGAYGGGITVDPHLGPISYWVIEHNQIFNNSIASTGNGAEGGGVWLTEDGRFNNNLVMNNSASGIIYGTGGGIIIIGATGHGSANIEMSNNYIYGNSASHWGGGIMSAVDPSLLAIPYVMLKNNIISGNTAAILGAAMHIQGGTYTFINNTITGNTGPQALEVQSMRGSLTMRFLNTISWNPNSPTEFKSSVGSNPKNINAQYSCIRGGYTGTGNINTDPLFVANDSMYHLSNSSPCIGTGIASSSVDGVTLYAPLYDYFNTPRPRGTGTNPDLGAVENDLAVSSVVKELSLNIPKDFSLAQNYPNPFNPSTTIRYALPRSAHITLTVHDILGREIATLVSEEQSAGWKEVQWDAAGFASGMYVVRMSAGNFTEMEKILLMK